MRGYVIKRTDQKGGYVARPGSAHSYTGKLELAQVFPTLSAAEEQRCPDNEVTISLEHLFR